MTSKCTLKWVEQLAQFGERECPYGWALLQVTWPDPTKASRMQLQYPNAKIESDWLTDDFVQGTFATGVFALYGYIPYLIMLLAAVNLARKPNTKVLCFLLFAICSTLFNEVILKNICRQHRPEHSCVTSCGMPSGHSTLAMGYLTLNLLDLLFRVFYMPRARRSDGFIVKYILGSVSPTPLAIQTEITHTQMAFSMFWWTFLLAPVPLSRIAVRDHTPSQALIGSLFGIIEATGWTYCMRRLMYRYKNWAGRTIWKFEHNHVLPYFIYLATTPVSERQDRSENRDVATWYENQDRLGDRDRVDIWKLQDIISVQQTHGQVASPSEIENGRGSTDGPPENYMESPLLPVDYVVPQTHEATLSHPDSPPDAATPHTFTRLGKIEVRLRLHYYTQPQEYLRVSVFYSEKKKKILSGDHTQLQKDGQGMWFSSPFHLDMSKLTAQEGCLHIQYEVHIHGLSGNPRRTAAERVLDSGFWQIMRKTTLEAYKAPDPNTTPLWLLPCVTLHAPFDTNEPVTIVAPNNDEQERFRKMNKLHGEEMNIFKKQHDTYLKDKEDQLRKQHEQMQLKLGQDYSDDLQKVQSKLGLCQEENNKLNATLKKVQQTIPAGLQEGSVSTDPGVTSTSAGGAS